jgi:hypothetical protein
MDRSIAPTLADSAGKFKGAQIYDFFRGKRDSSDFPNSTSAVDLKIQSWRDSLYLVFRSFRNFDFPPLAIHP